MADTEHPEPQTDPLIESIATAIMEHAAPEGAADYPRVAAAFAQLLAEMIGQQPFPVQSQMHTDFGEMLKRLITIASLRSSAGRVTQ